MCEDEREGSAEPAERTVSCPECDSNAYAVVPEDALIVDGDERADGKVWVNCWDCDGRFVVHFRT